MIGDGGQVAAEFMSQARALTLSAISTFPALQAWLGARRYTIKTNPSFCAVQPSDPSWSISHSPQLNTSQPASLGHETATCSPAGARRTGLVSYAGCSHSDAVDLVRHAAPRPPSDLCDRDSDCNNSHRNRDSRTEAEYAGVSVTRGLERFTACHYYLRYHRSSQQ